MRANSTDRRPGLSELCKKLAVEHPQWSKARILAKAKVLWTEGAKKCANSS